jgi:hypothetical protein
MSKLGFSEENAYTLEQQFGALSIWMGNKLKERQESARPYNTKDFLKTPGYVQSLRELDSIIDWIRVGLNNNISEVKSLSFYELADRAEQWHKELTVNNDSINYKESNPIILDFRKDDGSGFYWVDLQTSKCSEESERMGHCGASRGRIYSLRSFTKSGNMMINKSHLTASILNGKILQLKGVKNSKPKTEYHKYIIPLFFVQDNGHYLINTFGYEYDSANDFKMTDLTDDEISKIIKQRPELLNSNEELLTWYFNNIIAKNKIFEKVQFMGTDNDHFIAQYIKGTDKTFNSDDDGDDDFDPNPYTTKTINVRIINRKGEKDVSNLNPETLDSARNRVVYFNTLLDDGIFDSIHPFSKDGPGVAFAILNDANKTPVYINTKGELDASGIDKDTILSDKFFDAKRAAYFNSLLKEKKFKIIQPFPSENSGGSSALATFINNPYKVYGYIKSDGSDDGKPIYEYVTNFKRLIS